MPRKKKTKKQKALTDMDKLIAAGSYVFIFFVVGIIFSQHHPFIKHHARQGAVLFVFELALMVIAVLPIIGWLIGAAGWLFVMVVAVIGIFRALAGEEWEIPLLNRFLP